MIKKSSWVLIALFVISMGLLYSVPQAMAETLNYKVFLHVTQSQMIQIGDAASHWVALIVREGAAALETGEMAWAKGVQTYDVIDGGGPYALYMTLTFQDGSTIITFSKGISEKHIASGHPAETKGTAEIIKGTGRFEGITGTSSASRKQIPPEKGELGPKVLIEGTLTYTLPKKAQATKPGTLKTIKLPSGEEVYDLNGEWDALVENYGPGARFGTYSNVFRITQTGSTFSAILLKDNPPPSEGRAGGPSLQGELEKNGFKQVELVYSTGSVSPSKGQISEDGNKIVVDNGIRLKVTLTRK